MLVKSQKFSTRESYESYVRRVRDFRLEVGNNISNINKENKEFYIDGNCEFCNQKVSFLTDWKYSDNITINFRERMVCEKCHLNNRQRFIASYVDKMLIKFNTPKCVYIYEQVTPFYSSIVKKHQHIHTIYGSEYLGYGYKSGDLVGTIRHEDALSLSFDDESLDIIISQDVLEHVPDYYLAMFESFRVLKKGGHMLFSIPFYIQQDVIIDRIKWENGVMTPILPPQYHGNPVDKNGSLVTYDYGWDLFKIIKDVGFSDVCLYSYWNFENGYIGGEDQYCFIAIK